MNTQTENKKSFFIHTLGCKVNQYESQAMREMLTKADFKESPSRDLADVYIINTCTVTNRADKESRYIIGFLHRMNPAAKIVVTGCYAEDSSADLSSLPGVTDVVRNAGKSRIAEILRGAAYPIPDHPSPAPAPGPRSPAPDPAPMSISDFMGRTRAFVKIQDGCENSCSYCKVPLVRGKLMSRSVNAIMDETRILAGKGFREIVLAGICLGAWGKDLFLDDVVSLTGLGTVSLVDLLRVLDRISGDFRIRLSSIEPRYVTDELIDFMAGNKRMCRHLHIPFQSGDDEILRKMNRPYTLAGYRALVDRIRSRIKDIAITTDILIGFPGESDSNFNNTVDFIKAVLPARVHIFTFSRRKGTAAYDMGADIKNDILERRYHKLNTAALGASYLYRQDFLNKTLDVLVETRREGKTGLLTGYSDNYIRVLFEGSDALARRVVPVKINEMNLVYTFGVYGED